MTIIRRHSLLFLALVVGVAMLIPIVPTGWITRVDTTTDASSRLPVTKPATATKAGPRPFAVGDRIKMNYWNYGFGIPPGASGAISSVMKIDGCGAGAYGVHFDNFPPNTGYTGYCIPAWQLYAE